MTGADARSKGSDARPRSAPRVSVVIPAYNRERFVGPTIESVLGQTVAEWEMVVFDDGSTDATLEVARSYSQRDPRIRVAHGPNGGVALARNRGFALTDPSTEYVAFLDSDDLWERDALERLMVVLDSCPEFVAVHGLARCVDDVGQLVPGDDLEEQLRSRRAFRDGRLVALARDEPTTFATLVHHNWVVTPGTQLFRRAVVADLGGFDPVLDPADDADLALRASRLGDIGYIDRPVLRWRRHPQTLTNTSRRWRVAAGRFRSKTLTDPANTPEQFRLVCQTQQWAARSVLVAAFSDLRDGAFSSAIHRAATALDLYQAYLRARVTAASRRAAARWGVNVGSAPARSALLARRR
jgi:GT2 family glycosyltransferase